MHDDSATVTHEWVCWVTDHHHCFECVGIKKWLLPFVVSLKSLALSGFTFESVSWKVSYDDSIGPCSLHVMLMLLQDIQLPHRNSMMTYALALSGIKPDLITKYNAVMGYVTALTEDFALYLFSFLLFHAVLAWTTLQHRTLGVVYGIMLDCRLEGKTLLTTVLAGLLEEMWSCVLSCKIIKIWDSRSGDIRGRKVLLCHYLFIAFHLPDLVDMTDPSLA